MEAGRPFASGALHEEKVFLGVVPGSVLCTIPGVGSCLVGGGVMVIVSPSELVSLPRVVSVRAGVLEFRTLCPRVVSTWDG